MKKRLGFHLKERMEAGGMEGENDVTIVTKMSAGRQLATDPVN
jgi:hypothetical protein